MEVREVNRIASGEEDEEPASPWKLDIAAPGRNQLMVTGLGLDSEWRADLQIGGDTNQIGLSGPAKLGRGVYQVAGKWFELIGGTLRFTCATYAEDHPRKSAVTQGNGQKQDDTMG